MLHPRTYRNPTTLFVCTLTLLLQSQAALTADTSATSGEFGGTFDPSAIEAAASERAGKLQKIQDLLNSPDQNMRLAVFDQILKSNDPFAFEVGVDYGLRSGDPILRGLALRAAFTKVTAFAVQLSPSDPGAERYCSFEVREYSFDSGQFKLASGALAATAAIRGDKMEIHGQCDAFLSLAEGSKDLIGRATYMNKQFSATLPIQ